MYSGASLISLMRRANFVQSSSLIRPERMSASLIFASADSRRMTISVLLISSENTTLAIRCLMRARPQEVQSQRGVVRGHHALAGQIEVRLVVHLDASHRNGVHAAHPGDVRRRKGAAAPSRPSGQRRRNHPVSATAQFHGWCGCRPRSATGAGRPRRSPCRRRTRPRSTAART